MKISIRSNFARATFGLVVLTIGPHGIVSADSPEPNRGASIQVKTPSTLAARNNTCPGNACRARIRSSNGPGDGRTGGTPETSARTPGGPPDDVNAGLTFALPNLSKDWL